MRKVKLALEELQVESFATDGAGAGDGTVHGREFTVAPDCVTAQSGQPNCLGCQNSGVASCAYCQRETETCMDCSWTNGDGAECSW
jgi:hypothetical protein